MKADVLMLPATLRRPVIRVPVLRWGKPYSSLETTTVSHFLTGEPVAEVDQVTPGIVKRDLRRAGKARAALRELPIRDLLARVREAAHLYMEAELPLGDATQSPEEFVRSQSATTGLPESMCRANMGKNRFVLERMDQVLDALTRGLDLDILSSGHGIEERGVPVSYQAQTPVLACVLPSNSPGVHTLWLPVIPLQVGLVLKPGPEEPWTPYRMGRGVLRRRDSPGSDRRLSRRRRGGGGGGRGFPADPHFREPSHRRALPERSVGSRPRPGVFQDSAR